MSVKSSNDKCNNGGCGSHCRNKPPLLHADQQHLESAYAALRDVCDLLETIADSLPDGVDLSMVKAASFMLESCWSQDIFDREDRLLHAIETVELRNNVLLNFLRVLRDEHGADHDLICELRANLSDIIEAQQVRDPEAFGYMLRGVFVAIRRKVDLKLTVMMPAIETYLFSVKKSAARPQKKCSERGATCHTSSPTTSH